MFKSITQAGQLLEIKNISNNVPVILFKHSTRCSVSSMVLNRLSRNKDLAENEASIYMIDVREQRAISNSIAEDYHVYHESPQVLIIYKGECVYDESHNGIEGEELINQINLLKVTA
jgi:bacillithiol system protein YtxJ